MALIPLPPPAAEAPIVHAAMGGVAPSRWVNPDQIVQIVGPEYRTGTDVDLVGRVKLAGIPDEAWHLGRYPDPQAAAAGWAEFISYLQAHASDPAHVRAPIG